MKTPLHFSLFHGPNLAAHFHDAQAALAYMAEHADALGDDRCPVDGLSGCGRGPEPVFGGRHA